MWISSWNFVRVPEAKFQIQILIINLINAVVYFRGIMLESSRNVSETTPWCGLLKLPSIIFPLVVSCDSKSACQIIWIKFEFGGCLGSYAVTI